MDRALGVADGVQRRPAEGLVEVSGQDVFDLFDDGTKNGRLLNRYDKAASVV